MKLYKLHLQNLKADDGVINEAGLIFTVLSAGIAVGELGWFSSF